MRSIGTPKSSKVKKSPTLGISSARPAKTHDFGHKYFCSRSQNSSDVNRSTGMSWNFGNPSGGAVRSNSYCISAVRRATSSGVMAVRKTSQISFSRSPDCRSWAAANTRVIMACNKARPRSLPGSISLTATCDHA